MVPASMEGQDVTPKQEISGVAEPDSALRGASSAGIDFATPRLPLEAAMSSSREVPPALEAADPARTPRSEVPSAMATPMGSLPRSHSSLGDDGEAREAGQASHDYFPNLMSSHSNTLRPSTSARSLSTTLSASNSANGSSASIPELRNYPPHSTPSPALSYSSSQDSSERLRDLVLSRVKRSSAAPDANAPVTRPATSNVSPTVDATTVQAEKEYQAYPNQAFSALQSQAIASSVAPRPPRARPTHLQNFVSRSSHAPAIRRSSRDAPKSEGSGSRTVGHTPVSSPGLFGLNAPSLSPSSSADSGLYSSPYLHWTQTQRPKETHVADVDVDPISGRKLLNQYEIIDELGRGVHGKVKLGHDVDRQRDVAIKIVDRYSKRRRLGKLGNPEDKTKREVAILKKAIHPNVVTLLEVIDDPAKKKVYIILEFVELGEITWRVKGTKDTVAVERRRIEREKRGVHDPDLEAEDRRIFEDAQDRRRREEKARQRPESPGQEYWSLEYGGESENETETFTNGNSRLERWRSDVSKTLEEDSTKSPAREEEADFALMTALDGSMYGAYLSERQRRPDLNSGLSLDSVAGDPYTEDFAYVPCLTISQARQTFRDTVLGLEYLHYQGIIHRDIKPANLLWNAEHRVKISDFGVSYLGRPIRDDDNGEDLSEADAQPLDEAVELAKTVGTPAFYAPELCYTDLEAPRPSVTGQIDIWALGVTLYCLVFARVPFLADDQFSLFKSIVEDEVLIPRRRLKAVDHRTAFRSSSHSRSQTRSHRDDAYRVPTELIYEDIDDDLYDLFKRLLEKDPLKRMTLKEVKRHPFLLHGIADPIKWIDETDPSRQNEGRKIEVSNEDMEHAVVPLGFLDRVRSSMRRVGAAIGLGRAREGRRRAESSVQSADESNKSSKSTSPAATIREERRPSLRGDESIFAALKFSRESDHPLSQSVTASPEPRNDNPYNQLDPQGSISGPPTSTPLRKPSVAGSGLMRPNPPDRAVSTSGGSTRTIRGIRGHEGSNASPPPPSPNLPEQPTAIDPQTSPHLGGIFGGAGRRFLRSMRSRDLRPDSAKGSLGGPRTRSVDRVAMGLDDSHAEPSVAFSSTFASGRVDPPPSLREVSPGSTSREAAIRAEGFRDARGTHHHSRQGSANYPERELSQPPSPTAIADQLHISAERAFGDPEAATRASNTLRPRPHEPASESFARAQEQLYRRRQLELEQRLERRTTQGTSQREASEKVRNADPTHQQTESTGLRRGSGVTWASSSPPEPGFASPSVSGHEGVCSSSSDDHLGSGMSQSCSYPSMPSVLSAGSSISADVEAGMKTEGYPMQSYVVGTRTFPQSGGTSTTSITPSATGSTEASHTAGTTEAEENDDEDAGYSGDHGDESSADESHDDGGSAQGQHPLAQRPLSSPSGSSSDEGDFLVMARQKKSRAAQRAKADPERANEFANMQRTETVIRAPHQTSTFGRRRQGRSRLRRASSGSLDIHFAAASTTTPARGGLKLGKQRRSGSSGTVRRPAEVP